MSQLKQDQTVEDLVGEDTDPIEAVCLAETTKSFVSYSEASKAACAWVDTGKINGKPQPSAVDLVLYKSKLGPYKGEVVGLGIQRDRIIEDFVRIDNDNSGKGIHFNAKYRKDTSNKLAAVIANTVDMKPEKRDELYRDYVKALRNRSASFIWTWWSTGKAQ